MKSLPDLNFSIENQSLIIFNPYILQCLLEIKEAQASYLLNKMVMFTHIL